MEQTTIPGTEPPREPEPVAESERPTGLPPPCQICGTCYLYRDADGLCLDCARDARAHWSRCYAAHLVQLTGAYRLAAELADGDRDRFLARFARHEQESQP